MTIAAQTRCIWCLREQYLPGVWPFSVGMGKCRCGRKTVIMTHNQWVEILRARHTAAVGQRLFTCVDCDPSPVLDLPSLLDHLVAQHPDPVDPEDDDDLL